MALRGAVESAKSLASRASDGLRSLVGSGSGSEDTPAAPSSSMSLHDFLEARPGEYVSHSEWGFYDTSAITCTGEYTGTAASKAWVVRHVPGKRRKSMPGPTSRHRDTGPLTNLDHGRLSRKALAARHRALAELDGQVQEMGGGPVLLNPKDIDAKHSVLGHNTNLYQPGTVEYALYSAPMDERERIFA